MGRQILKGLTMLMAIVALAFVSAVATANGQTGNNVIAQVPFEFIVGDKTLASGEYSVRAINQAGDALMIRSADAKGQAIRLTNRTGVEMNKTYARLVFHRYGDRYFLSQVWSQGESTGHELLKGRQERAMERELARIASKSDPVQGGYEVVEIAALVR